MIPETAVFIKGEMHASCAAALDKSVCFRENVDMSRTAGSAARLPNNCCPITVDWFLQKRFHWSQTAVVAVSMSTKHMASSTDPRSVDNGI